MRPIPHQAGKNTRQVGRGKPRGDHKVRFTNGEKKLVEAAAGGNPKCGWMTGAPTKTRSAPKRWRIKPRTANKRSVREITNSLMRDPRKNGEREKN